MFPQLFQLNHLDAGLSEWNKQLKTCQGDRVLYKVILNTCAQQVVFNIRVGAYKAILRLHVCKFKAKTS